MIVVMILMVVVVRTTIISPTMILTTILITVTTIIALINLDQGLPNLGLKQLGSLLGSFSKGCLWNLKRES